VPVLGLVMAVGAGTASAARTPANARAAAAREVLEHLLVGNHALNQMVGHAASVKGLVKVNSSNWGGYADIKTSSTYSKVTGSWTEPKATCTSKTSLAAFWVGIDGYTSKSVEQEGTIIECISGVAHHFTWWEMYPANAVQFVGSTVKPGDHITASTVRTGTSYKLTVTDSTTPANSFTTTQTCAATKCVDTSTEWIAEAPSGSAGLYPLANFGSWTLTAATVTAGAKTGTISTFPDSQITMVSATFPNPVKAQPGPLNTAGNQFKVTWKAAT
jgi:Peptidase A4 family